MHIKMYTYLSRSLKLTDIRIKGYCLYNVQNITFRNNKFIRYFIRLILDIYSNDPQDIGYG